MKKYKSREYCRDIDCGSQVILDDENSGSYVRHMAKRNCHKCEAYTFHKWLKDNGYKIVKPRMDCELAEICYDMGVDNNEHNNR